MPEQNTDPRAPAQPTSASTDATPLERRTLTVSASTLRELVAEFVRDCESSTNDETYACDADCVVIVTGPFGTAHAEVIVTVRPGDDGDMMAVDCPDCVGKSDFHICDTCGTDGAFMVPRPKLDGGAGS